MIRLFFCILCVAQVFSKHFLIEEGDTRFESAKNCYEQLQKEIQWHFLEDAISSDKELVSDMQIVQDYFEVFRDALTKVLSREWMNDQYGYAFKAAVFLDATKWYVNFIESKLFREGWSSRFESYVAKDVALDTSPEIGEKKLLATPSYHTVNNEKVDSMACHPLIVQGKERLEYAEKRFKQLSDLIDWYIARGAPSEINDSAGDLSIKADLEHLQSAFIQLRAGLSDVLTRNFESSPYKTNPVSKIFLSVTEWYAEYIECHLFHQNWPEPPAPLEGNSEKNSSLDQNKLLVLP